MPVFHADMWELLFKFGLDAIVLFILIRLIYYPIPVSYTHLRAHETVLDLVCRLLLEKKKYTAT